MLSDISVTCNTGYNKLFQAWMKPQLDKNKTNFLGYLAKMQQCSPLRRYSHRDVCTDDFIEYWHSAWQGGLVF